MTTLSAPSDAELAHTLTTLNHVENWAKITKHLTHNELVIAYNTINSDLDLLAKFKPCGSKGQQLMIIKRMTFLRENFESSKFDKERLDSAIKTRFEALADDHEHTKSEGV